MATQNRYYEIIVKTPTGTLVDYINAEYTCRFTLRANKVGVLVLELPAEFCSPVSSYGIGDFGADYRIELRRIIGNQTELVGNTCWFINYLAIVQSEDGRRMLRIEAESALGLAGRRTVAYKSNDNASDLNPEKADDQLRRVMRDHFTSIATSYNTSPDPLRDLSTYLLIGADLSQGAVNVEMNIAHQPVLQALGRIADAAFAGGDRLFFDIWQISDIATQFLEFKTAVGQLGTNRTSGSGGANVVVIDTSAPNSPVSDYTFALDYRESAYRVYSGSQGRGNDQAFGQADDPGLASYVSTNPFALREAYIGTNELAVDTAKLNDQAKAELARLQPKVDLHGTLSENETFVWGVDWDWHDRLTILADGNLHHVWVETLEGELSGGRETITATFATSLHRSLDGLARVIQDTRRLEWWVKHLNALEGA